MAKKKRQLNVALIEFFAGMLLVGIFTIFSIVKIQSHGELINYVGIVRGGTQRLVKLELEGKPNDELIEYLDDILKNLNTGHGKYGLVLIDDKVYKNDMKQLNVAWAELKEDIREFRTHQEQQEVLLADSETYFDLANKTVFSAQDYAERQSMSLLVLIILMMICMVFLWVWIFRRENQKIKTLERSNKDLSELAGRDKLTGAYTLEYFMKTAQVHLNVDAVENYVLLCIDFEDFKYINDVFGVAYGDSILEQYVKIIQDDLREGELVGRVNADNFVVLRKYNRKEEILPKQMLIDKRLMEYCKDTEAKYAPPVCCGICCVADVVGDIAIEELIDWANFARKMVKLGIHKNYAFYDEKVRKRRYEENSIRISLERAFFNREFKVFYQPKVELKNETIACAEALVRWILPDGTIMPPDTFIPILEKDHNIAMLDQYVMEEVCKWIRAMLDEGRFPLPVSVNVSRIQFYNPDFVETYVRIREKYNVPKELLQIEFTETIAFDNTLLLVSIVNELKREGFPCAIDDFGKGYSSLGLLKDLPIDVLKIDRNFFVEFENEEKNRMIVEGIINIVRKLRIETVAEGIERQEQVTLLRDMGCDIVQGYFFYRPMPQEEYEKLLG